MHDILHAVARQSSPDTGSTDTADSMWLSQLKYYGTTLTYLFIYLFIYKHD